MQQTTFEEIRCILQDYEANPVELNSFGERMLRVIVSIHNEMDIKLGANLAKEMDEPAVPVSTVSSGPNVCVHPTPNRWRSLDELDRSRSPRNGGDDEAGPRRRSRINRALARPRRLFIDTPSKVREETADSAVVTTPDRRPPLILPSSWLNKVVVIDSSEIPFSSTAAPSSPQDDESSDSPDVKSSYSTNSASSRRHLLFDVSPPASPEDSITTQVSECFLGTPDVSHSKTQPESSSRRCTPGSESGSLIDIPTPSYVPADWTNRSTPGYDQSSDEIESPCEALNAWDSDSTPGYDFNGLIQEMSPVQKKDLARVPKSRRRLFFDLPPPSSPVENTDTTEVHLELLSPLECLPNSNDLIFQSRQSTSSPSPRCFRGIKRRIENQSVFCKLSKNEVSDNW